MNAPGVRALGVDPGTKRIGLAVSDLSGTIASPLLVLQRSKSLRHDLSELARIARAEEAAVIVVGLPINMDGSEGPRAQASRAFARNLAPLTDLPLVLWDERLSTVAAERSLIEMDVSRRKRDARIDSAAAAFILQGALDRLRSLRLAAQPSPPGAD